MMDGHEMSRNVTVCVCHIGLLSRMQAQKSLVMFSKLIYIYIYIYVYIIFMCMDAYSTRIQIEGSKVRDSLPGS